MGIPMAHMLEQCISGTMFQFLETHKLIKMNQHNLAAKTLLLYVVANFV